MRSTFKWAEILLWVCLKMLCTPLYPMVLLIIIPMKNGYFIGNIPYFQTNPCGGLLKNGDTPMVPPNHPSH